MSKYKELKEKCWKANMEVPRQKLAIYTFGNVSALDPSGGIFAIKPSGVPYDDMKPEDTVLVDIEAAGYCPDRSQKYWMPDRRRGEIRGRQRT